MMLHEDEQTAIERGIDGAHFFGYSLAHYYVFGDHRPGRHERLGRVPGQARRVRVRARDHQRRRRAAGGQDPPAGPRLAARCDRDAGPGDRPGAALRRRRSGPGDLRAAGGPEQARAHLRVAGAVRQEGAAAVRGRARAARGRQAGAARRGLRARARPPRAGTPAGPVLRDHATRRADLRAGDRGSPPRERERRGERRAGVASSSR